MNNLIESFQYWIKGGWLLIPLAGVCMFIWYYFIKMNGRLKKILSAPEGIEDELQEELAKSHSWSRVKPPALGRACRINYMIAYAIERLRQGRDLIHIFSEMRQKEFAPFERDLSVLSALVTSAPLLGLLGTVFGMVNTFSAIAERSSQTTELMASGISQALITTQFGLIIAIPGIFGISLLRKKLQQVEVRFSALQIHFSLGLHRRGQ